MQVLVKKRKLRTFFHCDISVSPSTGPMVAVVRIDSICFFNRFLNEILKASKSNTTFGKSTLIKVKLSKTFLKSKKGLKAMKNANLLKLPVYNICGK